MAQAPCKHHPGACTEAGSEEDKLRSSEFTFQLNRRKYGKEAVSVGGRAHGEAQGPCLAC